MLGPETIGNEAAAVMTQQLGAHTSSSTDLVYAGVARHPICAPSSHLSRPPAHLVHPCAHNTGPLLHTFVLVTVSGHGHVDEEMAYGWGKMW